jgi:hypothetical protein
LRTLALLGAILLAGCGLDAGDEIDAESAQILARTPVGTAFGEMPAAMGALGYACTAGVKQFTDRKGVVRNAESHYSCEREQTYLLLCTRRTRAILLQLNGQLSNILVNVGRFC